MNAERKAKYAALEQAIAMLSEHFDHVEIVACGDPKDCASASPGLFYQGTGNWYARKGMLDERLALIGQQSLAHEISRELDGPDDTEAWKKGGA